VNATFWVKIKKESRDERVALRVLVDGLFQDNPLRVTEIEGVFIVVNTKPKGLNNYIKLYHHFLFYTVSPACRQAGLSHFALLSVNYFVKISLGRRS
jgi:hypothetical protein